MPRTLFPAVPAAALLLGAAAGCGSATHIASQAPQAPATLPGPVDLQVRVGNAFRVALRRLSVASGVIGDAGDVGQEIPVGLLEHVRCGRGTAGVRCVVRWRTVDGRPARTTFSVAPGPGCFVATADPALPDIRDLATGSASANPIGEIAGQGDRC